MLITVLPLLSAPLSVTEASIHNNQSVEDIFVSWLPPSNRNGSFDVTFTFTATQVFIYQDRVQGDSNEINLVGSDSRTTRTETISGVLPYAEYQVTLTAFNRLFGKSRSSEPVTVSIITRPIGKQTSVNEYMCIIELSFMYCIFTGFYLEIFVWGGRDRDVDWERERGGGGRGREVNCVHTCTLQLLQLQKYTLPHWIEP